MTLTPEQEHEIAALRALATPTRRAVVAALEEILYQRSQSLIAASCG